MSSKPDYYKILGVDKNAKDYEIKKQYKKLACSWHPDKHINTESQKEAEEKFKLMSEAYQILSAPDKREIYDKHGHDGLEHMSQMHNQEEMFKNMFNGGMFHQESQTPDLIVELEVSYEQIYVGDKIKKEIERASLCSSCFGSGTKSGTSSNCKSCNGSGNRLVMIRPGMMAQVPCEKCEGTGKNNTDDQCNKCHGRQFIKEFYEIEVDVPRGVYDNYTIEIEEEGHSLPLEEAHKYGFKRSKAIFVIKEIDHKLFKKVHIKEKHEEYISDISVDVNITFGESILGFTKKIKHLDGSEINLSINYPTRHNDILVLKNHGLPKINDTLYGDLLINIITEHPNSIFLSETNKEKLMDIFETKRTEFDYETDLVWFDEYKRELNAKYSSSNMKNKYEKRKHNNNRQEEIPCHQM